MAIRKMSQEEFRQSPTAPRRKLTATHVMGGLTEKSLRKSTISSYLNQMSKAQQRELRRLTNEQFNFYRQLRQLVGIYRHTGSRTRNQKKRLAALPYSIESSGSSRWKFVDATRGISLGGNRLLIPTIQEARSGTMYLDLRIWSYQETDETMTVSPTRKGVCIPLNTITELRNRLTALDVRRKRKGNSDA